MALLELDELRYTGDSVGLNDKFARLINIDKEKAILLINSECLDYVSLYTLKSQIEGNSISEHINIRNKIAINITNEITSQNVEAINLDCSWCNYLEAAHSVLKWIFLTGSKEDGINDEFDKILDTTAAILVKVYSDTTVLPIIVDLIFKRNRRGYFYNDLVWIFFESQSPKHLILIANRFKSKNRKDIKLARKLLKFIPEISKSKNAKMLHISFLKWIDENILFLAYTGESFKQSTSPIQYRVVLEAKYLCKAVSTHNGNIMEAIDEEEFRLLEDFSELDIINKITMADYSYKMRKKDIYLWYIWLRYPMAQKINNIRMGIE